MMYCVVVRLYEGHFGLIRSRLKEQWSYQMPTRFEDSQPTIAVNDRELLDGVHSIRVSYARPVRDVDV